eukprot:7708301-Pyramimonas_sp.AAC.1
MPNSLRYCGCVFRRQKSLVPAPQNVRAFPERGMGHGTPVPRIHESTRPSIRKALSRRPA